MPDRFPTGHSITAYGGKSDPEEVRAADISILFIGNSHTTAHDLPNLVCDLIRHRYPDKKVHAHVVNVGFLDDEPTMPWCTEEIETRPWKFVVLQGQKISMSGRFQYSRQGGIDLAKLAKSRGARVFFFSEWGLKNVASDGARQEKIYQEMADAAGVSVAPIGLAWDLALAQSPDLPLYESDGNHESALGAFLSAAVLFGCITGESPATVASFPYPNSDSTTRKLLVQAAKKALANDAAETR